MVIQNSSFYIILQYSALHLLILNTQPSTHFQQMKLNHLQKFPITSKIPTVVVKMFNDRDSVRSRARLRNTE